MRCLRIIAALIVAATALCAAPVWSATPAAAAPAASAPVSAPLAKESKTTVGAAATGNLSVMFDKLDQRNAETSTAIRYVIVLTVAALIPSLLICMTAFLRIAIVLSMLRHAIGMPETPPNAVLIGLALFLTLFTMAPVLQTVNTQALQPFMSGSIGIGQGLEKAGAPLRDFMVRQTREADLALMVELSKAPPPQSIDDIGNLQLIPAFMLSELRAAFQIGFVVFLPFLLIDLIVSSILMSLGMMMMPPITIALPIKILMFILVDGWSVIVKALVGSFH
jgi:flagellar biosynthesis protein FliP